MQGPIATRHPVHGTATPIGTTDPPSSPFLGIVAATIFSIPFWIVIVEVVRLVAGRLG